MIVRSVLASTGPGVQAGRINTPLWRALVAGVGLLGACAPRGPAPRGVPTPVATPLSVAPVPVVTTVAIATPSVDARYAMRTDAIIDTRADTLARRDTVRTRSGLRVTPRGSAFDILLDSHVVMRRGVAPLPLVRGARALARRITGSAFEFVGAGMEHPCASPARAAFEATRELWVTWPSSLRVDARWTDSTTTAVCRDGVPLSLSTLRQYRVERLLSDTLLIVRREAFLHVEGSGLLRGDSTRITGDGTSDALLYLRPTTGWIDSAHVSGVLRLTVRGTVRTQQVEQRTLSHIHRAPNIP